MYGFIFGISAQLYWIIAGFVFALLIIVPLIHDVFFICKSYVLDLKTDIEEKTLLRYGLEHLDMQGKWMFYLLVCIMISMVWGGFYIISPLAVLAGLVYIILRLIRFSLRVKKKLHTHEKENMKELKIDF